MDNMIRPTDDSGIIRTTKRRRPGRRMTLAETLAVAAGTTAILAGLAWLGFSIWSLF